MIDDCVDISSLGSYAFWYGQIAERSGGGGRAGARGGAVMSEDGALLIHRFRVPMGDTDAAQIIYFGAPMRWAERLFTDWLATIGMPTSEVLRAGFGLPAVHAELSYRRPLRLDERVRGELRLHRRSARSITWRCEFFPDDDDDDGGVAVEVLITQVYARIDPAGPVTVPLPGQLLAHLPADLPAPPTDAKTTKEPR
jgi:acyl-CoA thioester hydrolase